MGESQIREPRVVSDTQLEAEPHQHLSAQLEARTRQLAESEARFRAVIENNADAIIVVDEDGIVRFANGVASRLFAHPLETLIGSSFGFPVVAGETTELDLPRGGSARVVEMRVVESEWEGRVACIATLRDVTERKRAEQSARDLIREQVARTAAEEVARRFRFLAEASNLLSASLEHRAILAQLARLCVLEIADWAVVYCKDKDDQLQRAEVAHRDPQRDSLLREFQQSPLLLPPAHPITQTLQTGVSIMRTHLTAEALDELVSAPEARALVEQLGMAAIIVVPIAARGRSLGALALISAQPDRPFNDQDLALAENLANRAGLAIDNARLYEQAREANQTKTELLAVISHDLRTPLNSIIGYAELLHMGIPEPLPDPARERIQRIRQSAGHLLYLIDELLAYARVEGNHEEVSSAEVDLGRIVREVGELMEPLAQQKKLELQIEVPESEVILRTDADKVRQVLMNLAGNAVKYTTNGHVRLGLQPSNNAVVLVVADSGPGIEPGDLPHIFEPFWQANRSQRNLGGGTGLGLSVVERILTLLGGEIRVESEVGTGSSFFVTLPLQ